MKRVFDASRDHALTASGESASAWPAGWRNHGGPWLETPLQRTHKALTLRHGQARADAIAEGRDEATNADLAAWRRIGSGVKA